VKPSRREDEVVRRRSALAFGLVLASGCGGPVGVKAPPGESSSSDGGAVTSGASTTGAASSSEGGTDPSRPPPPPFELPEGCGDGVIVPGQYDCFFPVPVDWVKEELGGSVHFYSLDLEGDGRDEVMAFFRGWRIAVLRWEDGELQLGPPIDSPSGLGSGVDVHTRWDWNGDGRRDFTLLQDAYRASVGVHRSLGAEGLGPHEWEHQLPPDDWSMGSYGATGHAVPIDVDEDGSPEVLASVIVDGAGFANPAEDLTLFRRMGSTWEPVGEAYSFGPCGVLGPVAYGDFDGDGDEDIAVLDHGEACDPYPLSYDPEWHRMGVLLSNSEAGVLELGGWYPTGGVTSHPNVWAEDVTGDGSLDLVVRISERVECDTTKSGYCKYSGVAVMRGRGDGSFEEGSPIDLGPTLPAYQVEALLDFDGDGTREWIVRLSEGRPWVIPFDLTKEGIAPLVALNDPGVGGSTRFDRPVGDVNGDGVDDYIVGSHIENSSSGYAGRFLMVSAP
jgi:hypothetical protein